MSLLKKANTFCFFFIYFMKIQNSFQEMRQGNDYFLSRLRNTALHLVGVPVLTPH